MISYCEWLEQKSSDYGMITHQDDNVLTNQMEQLVTRLQGLLHGVSENKKSILLDEFMRKVEERILGI
jgi:hypothetical protein